MSESIYDVIVIGGGHNGLTCGAYLARAGKKVLVLERRHVIGGAAVTEEFSPGFRTSVFSYVMSILHPKVIRDLGLRDLGLEVLPANDLFIPVGREDYLIFSGDVGKTAEQFARFSKADGAIYPEFDAWLCNRTPADRWGDPEELIGALVYLASGASSYVNGQIIYVDGGLLVSV